jgi:hypothetical protein
VLDEQAAHVVGRPSGRQLVKYFMGKRWVASQLTQNRLDVRLTDPHQTTVGPVHCGECVDDDLQLRCDQPGVVVSEQPLGGRFEYAALAAPAAVEFGLRAATDAVDVEPDAATAPAGWAVIDDARQHSIVAAGANPGCSFGREVAVFAD